MSRTSLWILIFVNILPVFGVLFLGWRLSPILIIYWMESFVVGMFNIPKIMMSRGTTGSKIGTVAFFCVHYGGFWLGHTLFLWAMLLPDIAEATGTELGDQLINMNMRWVFLALVVSHLYSFIVNFIGRHEYGKISPNAQMFVPYGRVFVLHIVILGGAALLARFAGEWIVAALFVALKIFFDGFFHVITHAAYDNVPDPLDPDVAESDTRA